MPIKTSLLEICKRGSEQDLENLKVSAYSFEDVNDIDVDTGLRPLHFILSNTRIQNDKKFRFVEALLLLGANSELNTSSQKSTDQFVEELPEKDQVHFKGIFAIATQNLILRKKLDELIQNIKTNNQTLEIQFAFTKPTIFVGENHTYFAPLHLFQEIDWKHHGYHHICDESPISGGLDYKKCLDETEDSLNMSNNSNRMSIGTSFILNILEKDFYFKKPESQDFIKKFHTTLLLQEKTNNPTEGELKCYLGSLKTCRAVFHACLFYELDKKQYFLHNIDPRPEKMESEYCISSEVVNMGFAYAIAIQLLTHRTPQINYMGYTHLLSVSSKVQDIFRKSFAISLPVLRVVPFEAQDCFQKCGVQTSNEIMSLIGCGSVNEVPNFELMTSNNVLLLDYSSEETAKKSNEILIACLNNHEQGLIQTNALTSHQTKMLDVVHQYNLDKIPFLLNIRIDGKSRHLLEFQTEMFEISSSPVPNLNIQGKMQKILEKFLTNDMYEEPTLFRVEMNLMTCGRKFNLIPQANDLMLTAYNQRNLRDRLIPLASSVQIEVIEDEEDEHEKKNNINSKI